MANARLEPIPDELREVIVSTPDTLHGGVRFVGTRIFAHQLFDYVLTGRTVDDFLQDFEGVTREKAQALLDWELKRIHSELRQAS